jgi:hypothetical protein
LPSAPPPASSVLASTQDEPSRWTTGTNRLGPPFSPELDCAPHIAALPRDVSGPAHTKRTGSATNDRYVRTGHSRRKRSGHALLRTCVPGNDLPAEPQSSEHGSASNNRTIRRQIEPQSGTPGPDRSHSRGVNPSIETKCSWHTCRRPQEDRSSGLPNFARSRCISTNPEEGRAGN